jgi:DNA replication and repair protein RecF
MLTDLHLCDFRPFPAMDFHPAAGANFLVGPNAQGKTSILEAVCLLLRLQSPRTNSPGECVRFGCPGFSVDGHWAGRHLHLKYQSKLKHFALDSKPQSTAADYLAVAKVVWISNQDLDLVRGSGNFRRRFLDFLGVQLVPGYLHHLRSYERALRSRNALLRDNRPRREVASFDSSLCTAGDALLEARRTLIASMQPLAADAYRAISGLDETFVITYEAGAATPMAASLAASVTNEERLRSTVVGPHRDDLKLDLEGKPAASFASEGQQRSIALSMKLAQARDIATGTGHEPLYLIDDVFGELDPTRRNNLLAALPAAAQKLITTTALGWLDTTPWPAHIHRLHNGGLTTSAG